MFNIRLKGDGFFSDKVSMFFAFTLGISAGVCLGSFLDLFYLGFDPVYSYPYRSMVNQIVFIVTIIVTAFLLIWYIVMIFKSNHLSVETD